MSVAADARCLDKQRICMEAGCFGMMRHGVEKYGVAKALMRAGKEEGG